MTFMFCSFSLTPFESLSDGMHRSIAFWEALHNFLDGGFGQLDFAGAGSFQFNCRFDGSKESVDAYVLALRDGSFKADENLQLGLSTLNSICFVIAMMEKEINLDLVNYGDMMGKLLLFIGTADCAQLLLSFFENSKSSGDKNYDDNLHNHLVQIQTERQNYERRFDNIGNADDSDAMLAYVDIKLTLDTYVILAGSIFREAGLPEQIIGQLEALMTWKWKTTQMSAQEVQFTPLQLAETLSEVWTYNLLLLLHKAILKQRSARAMELMGLPVEGESIHSALRDFDNFLALFFSELRKELTFLPMLYEGTRFNNWAAEIADHLERAFKPEQIWDSGAGFKIKNLALISLTICLNSFLCPRLLKRIKALVAKTREEKEALELLSSIYACFGVSLILFDISYQTRTKPSPSRKSDKRRYVPRIVMVQMAVKKILNDILNLLEAEAGAFVDAANTVQRVLLSMPTGSDYWFRPRFGHIKNKVTFLLLDKGTASSTSATVILAITLLISQLLDGDVGDHLVSVRLRRAQVRQRVQTFLGLIPFTSQPGVVNTACDRICIDPTIGIQLPQVFSVPVEALDENKIRDLLKGTDEDVDEEDNCNGGKEDHSHSGASAVEFEAQDAAAAAAAAALPDANDDDDVDEDPTPHERIGREGGKSKAVLAKMRKQAKNAKKKRTRNDEDDDVNDRIETNDKIMLQFLGLLARENINLRNCPKWRRAVKECGVSDPTKLDLEDCYRGVIDFAFDYVKSTGVRRSNIGDNPIGSLIFGGMNSNSEYMALPYYLGQGGAEHAATRQQQQDSGTSVSGDNHGQELESSESESKDEGKDKNQKKKPRLSDGENTVEDVPLEDWLRGEGDFDDESLAYYLDSNYDSNVDNGDLYLAAKAKGNSNSDDSTADSNGDATQISTNS